MSDGRGTFQGDPVVRRVVGACLVLLGVGIVLLTGWLTGGRSPLGQPLAVAIAAGCIAGGILLLIRPGPPRG